MLSSSPVINVGVHTEANISIGLPRNTITSQPAVEGHCWQIDDGNSLIQSGGTEPRKKAIEVALILIRLGFRILAEAELGFDLQGVLGG